LRSDEAAKNISARALLLEEFLAREAEAGRLRLPLGAMPAKAVVHGHCHQNPLARSSRSKRSCGSFPIFPSKLSSRAAAAWPAPSAMAPTTYQVSIEIGRGLAACRRSAAPMLKP